MDYAQLCHQARSEFYGLISAMNSNETPAVIRHAQQLRFHLNQMAREGSEEHARAVESFAQAVAAYRKSGGTSPLPNFPD